MQVIYGIITHLALGLCGFTAINPHNCGIPITATRYKASHMKNTIDASLCTPVPTAWVNSRSVSA